MYKNILNRPFNPEVKASIESRIGRKLTADEVNRTGAIRLEDVPKIELIKKSSRLLQHTPEQQLEAARRQAAYFVEGQKRETKEEAMARALAAAEARLSPKLPDAPPAILPDVLEARRVGEAIYERAWLDPEIPRSAMLIAHDLLSAAQAGDLNTYEELHSQFSVAIDSLFAAKANEIHESRSALDRRRSEDFAMLKGVEPPKPATPVKDDASSGPNPFTSIAARALSMNNPIAFREEAGYIDKVDPHTPAYKEYLQTKEREASIAEAIGGDE